MCGGRGEGEGEREVSGGGEERRGEGGGEWMGGDGEEKCGKGQRVGAVRARGEREEGGGMVHRFLFPLFV